MNTGFSMRYSKAESKPFVHTLVREQEEIPIFGKYYLEEPFDE
jgi:hypothetical protein